MKMNRLEKEGGGVFKNKRTPANIARNSWKKTYEMKINNIHTYKNLFS